MTNFKQNYFSLKKKVRIRYLSNLSEKLNQKFQRSYFNSDPFNILHQVKACR